MIGCRLALIAFKPDATKDFGDSVSVSNNSVQSQTVPQNSDSKNAKNLPPSSNSAMEEYYSLQQNLLICTLVFTGVAFFSVWGFYSLHIALNYLIGACTGVVYLRMLAKSVAQLGRERSRLGSSRLAIVVGLIIVATQLNQLEVLPIFLGFLTYKFALIGYTLWVTLVPKS